MPDPPDTNLLTRYILENPWPLGILVLLIALWLGWSGMREGAMKKLQAAIALGIAGAVVLIVGYLVVTPGERAQQITRQMVNFAVAGDSGGAISMFSPEAAFAIGSPRNPGLGYEFIQEQLIALAQRYAIESNTITSLKGYTESSRTGVAHLSCFTTIGQFPYPTSSRWVLRVQRESDGEWKIVHLTCVSINDRTPRIEQLQ